MTADSIPGIVKKLPKGGMIWCDSCQGFWFKDDQGGIGHVRTSGPGCKYDRLMDRMEGNT